MHAAGGLDMPSDKSTELYKVLLSRGFEQSLCYEIAYRQMNTDYTATRMLGSLYRMSGLTEEMLVDEMLAILDDRSRYIKKHEMEHAQQAINRIYDEGMP